MRQVSAASFKYNLERTEMLMSGAVISKKKRSKFLYMYTIVFGLEQSGKTCLIEKTCWDKYDPDFKFEEDRSFTKVASCACHSTSLSLGFHEFDIHDDFADGVVTNNKFFVVVIDGTKPVDGLVLQMLLGKIRRLKHVQNMDEWIFDHVIVVRSKCDDTNAQRYQGEFLRFVAREEIRFLEVSAKTGKNMDKFELAIMHMMLKHEMDMKVTYYKLKQASAHSATREKQSDCHIM